MIRAGIKTLQVLAFAISAALSIRLFVGLATDIVSTVLMAGLAVCLEGGKVVAIQSASSQKGIPQTILAIVLVALSLAASAGSSLLVIEGRRVLLAEARGISERELGNYDFRFESVQSMDAQIVVLSKKLDETPATWAGTNKALREELNLLREARRREFSTLDDYSLPALGSGKVTAQADMFELLARATGIPYETFILAFLLAVAAALEALIVIEISPQPINSQLEKSVAPGKSTRPTTQTVSATTRKQDTRIESSLGRKRPGRPRLELDTEALLPEFMSHILEGVEPGGIATVSRDGAAKAMGLSSWQAKTLYRMAVERGLIETCGRRTRAGLKSA
jgi:hypothetical protein